MSRRALLAVVPLLLAPLASASTWIVDDGGGPGVDFTSIQAAINASDPGDVLLVQPGSYGSFTLSIPLSIVGQGGPTLAFPGKITVSNISAGGRVILVGLAVSGSNLSPWLVIDDCGGTVIGDDLQGTGLGVEVSGSADVRLRRASGGSLRTDSSRTEVVESNFTGASGSNCFCCDSGAEPGFSGIFATGGELHLARSSAHGGDAGDESCGDTGFCSGDVDGGHGVRLQGGATALVSGDSSHVLAGGLGGITGSGCSIFPDGADGLSVFVAPSSQLRISGVAAPGTSATVTPADPTLRLIGTPTPGANLTFRVIAPPGSDVVVILGRQPIVIEAPGLEEDVLATTHRTFQLGTVPPTGVVSLNFPTSASWPKGFLLVFQAVVTVPDSSVRRTHSIPVVLR